MVPRDRRCKQALLLGLLILAGCGGSRTPEARLQTLQGPGFTFQAPGSWTRSHTRRAVSASHDSELVQVATFPLVKPYTDALFDRVAKELAVRMKGVALQSHGTVTATRTVEVDGIRSHAYDVTVSDHVDEYTFVLNGMHEHQLLCRRRSSDRSGFCATLVTSFARA